MDEHKQQTLTLVLMLLLAGWLLAYGTSIYALADIPGNAAATLLPLRRSVGFLGWQGVAGIIAFGCWGVGRSFPKGSGIRRVSAVPLAMAAALFLVVAGMAVFR